jgi:flagellar biosynthesis/type III secretory pathway protein FliH
MTGLWKGGRASALIPRVVQEAGATAEALLAAAAVEAARLRAEVDAEREAARAAAALAGRREGLAQAAAALAAVAEVRRARLAGLEAELGQTALEVARAVLGMAFAESPEALGSLARRALELARDRREVVLRVSPGDAPALRGEAGALAALLHRCPALEVREDATLARGDVVVETEAGRIDARIETQLAALARALEELEPCAMD